MNEQVSRPAKATRIQVISLALAFFLLIGWNLIWLSTVQYSDGFHMMPGWGLMKDDQQAGEMGFIPLLPLFFLLIVLLVLLARSNREAGPRKGSTLDPIDILKAAGMTLAIVGTMVLLPQLSGLGPGHGPAADWPSTPEMLTHLFGMLSIVIPLFIIGLMFKTYQKFNSQSSQEQTDSGEEE